MASAVDITIDVKIEPVVKVTCESFDCVYNLIDTPIEAPHCNLKYIKLTRTGHCSSYEKKGGD